MKRYEPLKALSSQPALPVEAIGGKGAGQKGPQGRRGLGSHPLECELRPEVVLPPLLFFVLSF